jgi:hypothetical protein
MKNVINWNVMSIIGVMSISVFDGPPLRLAMDQIAQVTGSRSGEGEPLR